MNNNIKKSYQLTKAVDNIRISRSTYTKDLKILKEQAKLENRTALEFCVWFDYTLVSVCNLNTGPFSAILELIDNKHILNNLYVKPFRLACLIFQEFLNSNNELNKKKVADFLIDYPKYGQAQFKKFNFDNIYNYDRVKANKIMFPYFAKKGISKNLISALIYRQFLAFDDKFNNLLFISQDDFDFHGLTKQGITPKHFMKHEYNNDTMPFFYWQERDEKVILKKHINKVVFYDTTLYMLKKISYNIEENTLYCSLHTPNASPNLYHNTIQLLSNEVEVLFDFENELLLDSYLEKVNKTKPITEVNEVIEEHKEVVKKQEDYESNKQVLLEFLKDNRKIINDDVYLTIMAYVSHNKVFKHHIADLIKYLEIGDEELLEDFCLPF